MLNRLNGYRLLMLVCALTITPLALAAGVDQWQMNMFQGVTPLSHDMYMLHMVAIYVCAFIGLVVFGAMFSEWTLLALPPSQRAPDAKAATAKADNSEECIGCHGDGRIEIDWFARFR